MAQKTTQAVIVLGGRVDNSFTQLGDALLNMGNMVDNISSKLIDFGKESIDTYRDYQTNMLDAEVALSTAYGRGTRELQAVMANLNTQAREWAMQSKFTTEDISNAIAEAAHANWDESQILSGLPSAMQLAQAGGMDLSEALNYVIKTTNAAGIAFDEMPGFIDKWIYAANSSAATVESYGDAFLRLGSSMRFAGSEDELLTLLATMHDMGAEGTEAATLLRNTMIRLIAPTDKAAQAMAFLGVSDEEVNAALAETKGNAKKAAEKLKDLGFSAYDQRGNLKSFLNIFTDLGNTIEGMTEEEQYEVLSSIFPTKTITGALNVLRGLNKEMTLYNDLSSGKAAGYGEYASGVMMSGLEGAQKIYESRLQELKRKTGETLEGDATWFFETAGNFINNLNGMDDASFSMLVGGLEGIAAAGPALSIAGLGIRGIGYFLGSNVGRFTLAAIAIAALSGAMKKFYEYDYESKFGTLTLNSEEISIYLETVKKPFIDATADLTKYTEAMNAAVQAYTDKSSELAQGIITKMVTGTTLTPEEEQSFFTMGDNIGKELIKGINNGYQTTTESLINTFGGDLNTASDNSLFRDLNGIMQLAYQESISKAQDLSKELRDAMTSAFEDHQLTPEEARNIQAILDEMNQILALETNANMYAEENRLMRRAQTLGIEGLEQFQKEADATRSEILDAMREDQDRTYGQMKAYLEFFTGRRIILDGEEYLVDETFKEQRLDQLEQEQKDQIVAADAELQKALIRIYDNLLYTSAFSNDAFLYQQVAAAVSSGELDPEAVYNTMFNNFTNWTRGTNYRNNDLINTLNNMITNLGGKDYVEQLIQRYNETKDYETAGMLQSMLNMQQLSIPKSSYAQKKDMTEFTEAQVKAENYLYSLSNNDINKKAEEAKEQIDEVLNPSDVDVRFLYEESLKQMEDDVGKTITKKVNLETTTTSTGGGDNSGSSGGGLWGTIKSWFGFAEGGRSDEPAIFGEGETAEWAIPEAHTPRTAGLLTAAAEASGFTWGELASASGSGNGGGSYGDGITVHYSPVIHSDNAGDIDRILREDKQRLRKEIEHILDDRKLYESVVSYG